MPKRIKRERSKGWRLPPNTVIVSRPTKWGNPFTVAAYGARQAVLNYKGLIALRIAIGDIDINELRGKDLACWCPVESAYCHADILLSIAREAK